MFDTKWAVCSDIKIMGMMRKRKVKREKKIKGWKLKDESVKVEFEKSYEKRRENLILLCAKSDKKVYFPTLVYCF